MKLSELKIRDKISCRISGGSGGNVYHLRVEDTIENKFLLTDLPIVSTRKIRFNIDSAFDFLFIDDSGIYFFEGKIVENKNPDVMKILIKESEFSQIQRRSFFRLQVDMRCGILLFGDFFNEKLLYNNVNIENVSATSIRVVSSKKLKYDLGDLIYVRTELFSRFSGGLWGKVYKIDEYTEEDSSYNQVYIIKFIFLSDQEIEDNVKIIFKKQRQILKSTYNK